MKPCYYLPNDQRGQSRVLLSSQSALVLVWILKPVTKLNATGYFKSVIKVFVKAIILQQM